MACKSVTCETVLPTALSQTLCPPGAYQANSLACDILMRLQQQVKGHIAYPTKQPVCDSKACKLINTLPGVNVLFFYY